MYQPLIAVGCLVAFLITDDSALQTATADSQKRFVTAIYSLEDFGMDALQVCMVRHTPPEGIQPFRRLDLVILNETPPKIAKQLKLEDGSTSLSFPRQAEPILRKSRESPPPADFLSVTRRYSLTTAVSREATESRAMRFVPTEEADLSTAISRQSLETATRNGKAAPEAERYSVGATSSITSQSVLERAQTRVEEESNVFMERLETEDALWKPTTATWHLFSSTMRIAVSAENLRDGMLAASQQRSALTGASSVASLKNLGEYLNVSSVSVKSTQRPALSRVHETSSAQKEGLSSALAVLYRSPETIPTEDEHRVQLHPASGHSTMPERLVASVVRMRFIAADARVSGEKIAHVEHLALLDTADCTVWTSEPAPLLMGGSGRSQLLLFRVRSGERIREGVDIDLPESAAADTCLRIMEYEPPLVGLNFDVAGEEKDGCYAPAPLEPDPARGARKGWRLSFGPLAVALSSDSAPAYLLLRVFDVQQGGR